MFFTFWLPRRCLRSSNRRRLPRPFFRRAGAGMQRARWLCCAFKAARKCRRRFSAGVLTEALDIEGLGEVLRGIEQERIRCLAVDTPVPSQFSHEILNANPYAYLDDAPLEERRARAVEMRRVLPASVLEEVGALDAAAIAQVQREAWPDVRDADELHDVLHTLVSVPVENSSQFSVL